MQVCIWFPSVIEQWVLKYCTLSLHIFLHHPSRGQSLITSVSIFTKENLYLLVSFLLLRKKLPFSLLSFLSYPFWGKSFNSSLLSFKQEKKLFFSLIFYSGKSFYSSVLSFTQEKAFILNSFILYSGKSLYSSLLSFTQEKALILLSYSFLYSGKSFYSFLLYFYSGKFFYSSLLSFNQENLLFFSLILYPEKSFHP